MTLTATLTDGMGGVFDTNTEEVEFTLTAEGLDAIVVTATAADGVATVTLPLEPAIYTIDIATACSDASALAYLVVFNPDGGFATGGGWLVPEDDGLNTHLTRANFGFNAKYKKGAATGHLEFRFSDGYVDLKSDTVDQLVITGGKIAQFKGTATVNGTAGYRYFVKAIDNGNPGTSDVFDIKIWSPGSDVSGDAAVRAGGTLAGGNIVVHNK